MTRNMKRLLVVAAVLTLAGLNGFVLAGRGNTPSSHVAISSDRAAVAGPGVVEAASEEVRVTAQIGGTLQEVGVEEGDRVRAGQVIAIVSNADYSARVASAEAELAIKKADRRRTVNGARVQERLEAAAGVREAEATLANARADHARKRGLFNEQVISRDEMDRAEEQLRVGEAKVEAARQRFALVDADARDEDRLKADADVQLATARLREARAVYEKTFVRAPIDGIVLRKFRKAGESVSTQFDSPIVTIADRSTLRVRVDVDESDVAKLMVGEPAYITADAFKDRRFTGRVVRIGQILGPKNVRTGDPTERVDQKILETLVELDQGHELPIGLRVQAFIGRARSDTPD